MVHSPHSACDANCQADTAVWVIHSVPTPDGKVAKAEFFPVSHRYAKRNAARDRRVIYYDGLVYPGAFNGNPFSYAERISPYFCAGGNHNRVAVLCLAYLVHHRTPGAIGGNMDICVKRG